MGCGKEVPMERLSMLHRERAVCLGSRRTHFPGAPAPPLHRARDLLPRLPRISTFLSVLTFISFLRVIHTHGRKRKTKMYKQENPSNLR